MRGMVYIIGAGPGDPELITVKGQKIIQEADVIIYTGSLVPKDIVKGSRAKLIDSSSITRDQINETILDAVQKGEIVARVHTGDPSLYGALHEEIGFLEEKGIRYKIIPGVTAAFALAAEAKLSLTIPENTQTVIFTRIAGKTTVPEKESLERLASHGASLAIYLSAPYANQIKERLIKGGYLPETPVFIGHRVGWKEQKIIRCPLSELDRVVKKEKIKRQTIFLVLPKVDKTFKSKLYDPEFTHCFRK